MLVRRLRCVPRMSHGVRIGVQNCLRGFVLRQGRGVLRRRASRPCDRNVHRRRSFSTARCWTTPTTSSARAPTRVWPCALLEVLLIVANIGTAVVLFPILKRQNEGLALGYVTARLVESTFIAIGIVSLLAIVTLRQDVGGAGDADSLVPAR
jgi:Domain of unknown function (DUF4386)